jgi:hypothetical protein
MRMQPKFAQQVASSRAAVSAPAALVTGILPQFRYRRLGCRFGLPHVRRSHIEPRAPIVIIPAKTRHAHAFGTVLETFFCPAHRNSSQPLTTILFDDKSKNRRKFLRASQRPITARLPDHEAAVTSAPVPRWCSRSRQFTSYVFRIGGLRRTAC